MNIVIQRIRNKYGALDGHLFIDGGKVCDTTENATFHLPEGSYRVELHKCQIGKRMIPVINIQMDSNLSSLHAKLHCRNCEKCAEINDKNTREYVSMFNAFDHIFRRGEEEGTPMEQVMAEARALEEKYPNPMAGEPLPYCPQFKPGNGVHHSLDHSILVGQYRMPGLVIQSRPVFNALFERLRKASDRGNEITLRICDKYEK